MCARLYLADIFFLFNSDFIYKRYKGAKNYETLMFSSDVDTSSLDLITNDAALSDTFSNEEPAENL